MTRMPFQLVVLLAAIAFAGCGSDAASDANDSQDPAKNAVVCPEGAVGTEALDTDKLIGMNLAEAESEAKQFECTVRPVEVDGEPQVTTMDLRQDRVNVVIESDEITAVKGVY